MPVSEARKRANNKYAAKNYTIVGCKLRRDLAAAFKEKCAEKGTTPNEVFRKVIDDFMKE